MKLKELVAYLTNLKEKHPNAEIYFTDGNNKEWFETYFQGFNIDKENNMIEMLFDTEE